MKYFLSALLVVACSGCTHSIHRVGASAFVNNGGQYVIANTQPIQATAEQDVVIFASDTQYVNDALNALQEQCRDGEIIGITTQHSTSHGFFSWTNKILMKGTCISHL